MALALLKLLGLATLAMILGASLDGAQPVSALSIESHHVVRHDQSARHAGVLARSQASARRRCRARATSSSHAASQPSPNSVKPTSESSQAPRVSPTPAPNPSPRPVATNGSDKVGIAFAGAIDVAKFAKNSPKLVGVYNWSPYKDTGMVSQLPNGAQFYPMLWGTKQKDQFQKSVKAGYAKTVLGMNEPNQSGQSDLSPSAGASLWKQYIQPLASQGYRLISPAPTNAPSGKTWLKDFISACGGCTVDGIATHFYGTDAEALVSHLTDYHNTFGRPVWLTEFACQNFGGGAQCSKDQVYAFMKRTTQFMDAQNWMAFYAWFGALLDMGNVNPANQLVNGDSTPNTLGRRYLGLEGWP